MNTSLVGYVALAGLVGLTLRSIASPPSLAGWLSRPLFAALLGLTIIAAHAPVLNFPQELPNPDEAQLLAGALTLRQHCAPWRSVDLSTAGPLSVLPFLIIPVDFPNARWCAALCSAFMVTGCWLALTCVRDHPLARIAALPVAAFFVFMQDIELFQFSTEHVAVVLLAAAAFVWLKSTAQGEVPLRPGPALGYGLLLGSAVMAKLQSAPCAAWLAIAGGGLALLEASAPWSRRLAVFAAVGAGCAAVPLFFAGLAASQGVLPDMVHSYGLNNLDYVARMEPGSAGYQPSLVWGLNYLLKPAGVVGLLCIATAPAFTPAERRTALLTVGLAAAAIIAVVLPGRGFGHYWFFVLGPVLLALGTVLVPAWRRLQALRPDAPALQRWSQTGLLALLLVLPVAHRFTTNRDAALARVFAAVPSVRSAGEKVRTLAQAGDALTVWGWRPEVYVFSGLPQGTREANTVWQIAAIPQRDYYRQRFLADLARTRPRFFVDAVGPGGFGYTERAEAGHETFAALGGMIKTQYAFLGEIDAMRIYVRHAD